MHKTNILPQHYVDIIDKNCHIKNIIDVQYFASGIDADIFKLTDIDCVCYALKKSKDNFFDNQNDIHQDDVALFKQEAAYSNLINQADIKLESPKSIYVNACHKNAFHLMAFIEDDGRLLTLEDFVSLLSQLHSINIDDYNLVKPISHEGWDDVNVVIAQRMLRRLKNLQKWIKLDLDWLNFDKIVDIAKYDTNDACLLHMDFRRSNLLYKQNRLFVIDWANALIGSPLVEIARLEVFGELDGGLKTEYLKHNAHVDYCHQAYLLYLLDTAIMMNLVFLASTPNQQMAKKFEQKLVHIIAALKAEIL